MESEERNRVESGRISEPRGDTDVTSDAQDQYVFMVVQNLVDEVCI